MSRSPRLLVLLAAAAAVLSVSCVGIAADASVKADGSGSVSVEYRVSRLVEAMGKVSGGERWLPLPVERTDMESFALGIEGIELNSFDVRKDDTDITVNAVLAFNDVESLVLLLNSAGRAAAFSESGGKRTLTMRLAEGGGPLDPDLKRLVDTVFKGYNLSLRFSFPALPSVQGGGSVEAAARRAVYASPVVTLLSAEKPVSWIITW